MFLLYFNDLTDTFENLNCVVKLYADDAKLFSSFKLGDYLLYWSNSRIWQLRIANNKCIARIVYTIQTSATCDYAIEGYKLQWSNCTKDLGVDIDLKCTEHISNIV